MTDNPQPRRSARWVRTNNPDLVALKIPCSGVIEQHDGEQPCPVEQRLEVTLDQHGAYMAGDPLDQVWPDGVPTWVLDPWCEDHR